MSKREKPWTRQTNRQIDTHTADRLTGYVTMTDRHTHKQTDTQIRTNRLTKKKNGRQTAHTNTQQKLPTNRLTEGSETARNSDSKERTLGVD